MTANAYDSAPSAPRRLTRRGFVQAAGATALTTGAGLALAACGSGSSAPASTTSAAASGAPKHGGTLRIGLTGGASTDTLDPQYWATVVDYSRAQNLYDPLVQFSPLAVPELVLAEEITPNADATEWTIRVRSGVTFHNGKPLTADDVAFTFRRMFNPKLPGYGASYLGGLDVANIKKVDNLTIRLPFKAPFSVLAEALAVYYYQVLPVGFDPKHPVGTGPFKYVSFTPGQQSEFTRNASYWQTPLPYADELIITDYPSQTSQVNAMVGNEVDAINGISAAGITPVQNGGGQVVISDSGSYEPIAMRVDLAPFSDVRVRQALRLAVDRPQMLKLLFAGHGTLGNDTWGIWDPAYDHSLPQRQQDIEQAKSLLKGAGQESLAVQLNCAPLSATSIQCAEIFAQDAASVGAKVSIHQVTVTELYGTEYTKWPFLVDLAYYEPYLPEGALSIIPTAPYDDTHFHDPTWLALYNKALSTVDATARTQVIHDMQQIDYDRGSMIIPYFMPVFDAHRSAVQGAVPDRSGSSFNGFDFKQMWLS
jgi:peptide/nickel transport system substrate-binding protein